MRSLILFIFYTISFLASAQEFSQFHYTTANGLLDNRVLSIEQDSRGFMWFGLVDGLSRFDGSVFKNYRNSDSSSLPLNWIDQLYETTPGYLVLTTAGCKLLMLNTYTGQFYRPSDFSNRPVCGISRISSSQYLLTSVDTCFIADQNMRLVDAVVPDLQKKNGLIVGQSLTENLCLISLQNDPTEFFIYHRKTRALHKLDLRLTARDADVLHFNFYDSANQWLYFVNYFSGVYRYTLDGTRLKHWPMYGYGWSKPFSDSTLLIGTIDAGAVLLDLKRDVTTPFRINNEINYDANVLFADREGHYWLGTDKGVTRLNASREIVKSWKNFEGQPDGVPFPLRVLRGKDQRMYLTFYTLPSLYQLDSKKEEWKRLSKNLITGPWCANPIGDDIIFTGGGTMRFTTFSPLTGKFQHSADFLRPYFPNSDVLILAFQHSNGDRWYSANKGGGFVRITRDGGIHHYTKDGSRGRFSWSYYTSYAEDDSGDLWFGVNKTGLLLHWNYQTDRFSEVLLDTIPGLKGKVYDVINEVIRDNKNNIWIAFDGGGVIRYNHTRNRATRFTDEDGLASRHVSSMIFDSKGRLWLTTYTKGISCLLVDENKVRTFTKEDGLTESEFPERCMFYDRVENNLWVGGASSVMRFNPDTLLAQGKKSIPVYLDEIYVNGKRDLHSPYDPLVLTYHHNNLQFRFVAIDMDRQSLQLAYKLEGYDTAWVNSLSGTIASYANLPPGEYAFMIKAYNTGDVKQASFSKPFVFHIATPWFMSWWFRLSIAVSAVLSTVLLVRFYYARKTEKQRLILEKEGAVEKERTRIATDMHDDFGTSLSRIKFISERMKLKSQLDEALKNDLTKISGYSDEMAGKMNEIVWALNERFDSVEDLVSFCRSYAAEYLDHHKIELDFSSQGITGVRLRGEARRNIYLVLKEALHNTIKHAGATRVKISFEQSEFLQIDYSDNGKGFDLSSIRPFANGLSNMEKRMQDVNGSFDLIVSNGVKIRLNVPIG